MRAVFVHGACVKDGEWWWRPTAALLQERGVPSAAPLLPSCGEGPGAADGAGLAEDAAAVRQALEASDEPAVVVAHSYGGIVAAEALAGAEAGVSHLLLVSSYLPEPGQSLSSFGGEGPAPFLDIDPERGRFTVRADAVVDIFLPDCDQRTQQESLAKMAWQNLSVVGEPVTAAGWQSVPTTYLVCAQDRGTPADRQREFARRADSTIEIDAGHHPFLSRPADLRDLVLGLG